MRMAALIAILLLVAGCSSSTDGESERITPIPPNTSRPSSTTTPSSKAPTKPPDPGAPVAEVIAWIEAGKTVDAAQYHAASRDGVTTDLGEDVAFITPSGKTNCMTDSKYSDGALACLVELTDPPPRPADSYGEWKGGWVDFDGPTVAVGSIHGDPGRFTAGTGPQLPYEQAIGFGDYQCRVDPVGLYCANRAHNTAVRYSDAGIEPFGCLKQVTAPPQIGEKFSC